MTSTVHAVSGALIAAVVKQPALAIPLALVSHFVLDSLPHFGYKEWHNVKLSKIWVKPKFRLIYFPDMFILFPAALIALPLILKNIVPMWLSFICAFAAAAPDITSGVRILIEKKGLTFRVTRFEKFHRWEQWCERPWGMIVELCFLALMLVTIKLIAK